MVVMADADDNADEGCDSGSVVMDDADDYNDEGCDSGSVVMCGDGRVMRVATVAL